MPFIYETFAQRKISAEANAMTEYVLGLRGIVPNYGSQFLLQSVGTVLKVGTGMLVFTGRKGINTELIEIDVVPEALGTKTKYIIVTLDGTQQPTSASASITVSDTSEGSITSKTEDLMANVQGIVKFDLGTFTNTTSGIDSNSLTITCPIIEQEIIDNIKDDVFGLQGDLSDLRDDFDNLEIGARNILRGTANPILTTSTAEGTWENGKFYYSATSGASYQLVDVQDSPVPSVNIGILMSATTSDAIGILQSKRYLESGDYTLSFWAKGNQGDEITVSTLRPSGTIGGLSTKTLQNSGWNYITEKKTVSISQEYDLAVIRVANQNTQVTIIAPQVERSNIASDWRPAPEDNFGLKIGARNILRGTANPILTTSSTIGTWANGKFYINQTGGTITNSIVSDSPVPSVNYAFKIERLSSGVLAFVQFGRYLQNGEYTVGFWVKGTVGSVVSAVVARTASQPIGSVESIYTITSSGWNFFQHTQNILSNEDYQICRIELKSTVIGQEVTILAPQVERSNIASDWRPAPDDIPYTRSQLISSATYLTGDTIPYDLSPWDTIEVSSFGNLMIRLVKTRDGVFFRGGALFLNSSGEHRTMIVELSNLSGSWKLSSATVLTHETSAGHSSKINTTIRDIYGISYR